ncbi:MAG: low molecular weight phosphotyrosine protein phosphatase [Spirochaetaceae bacterium]|nr:MAG: low molecular weight phosphotyrosine protein phosphatase [Spirochaetaceae bacterium]
MSHTRIMFVCQGNICRSPLAEAVFNHLLNERALADRYRVDSTGVSAYHQGENADPRMRQVAAGHGVTVSHRARSFAKSDLDNNDIILAMDRSNYDILQRNAETAEQRRRIVMFRSFDPSARGNLDVPDPWYGGIDGFETVFTIVERTCRALLDQLERETTDG